MKNKDKTTQSTTLYDKVVMFVLLTFPILQIYDLGPLNLALFCELSLIAIGICTKQLNYQLPRNLSKYLLYICFVIVISADFNLSWLSRLLGIGHTFLLFVLFYSRFEFAYFIKLYRRIAIVCILFFFFQEFIYRTTGFRPTGIIPFLPVTLGDGGNALSEYMSIASRSSYFFSEPAHVAQFLLPLLAYELFYRNGRRSDILIGASLLALLLLMSGNGVIGLICIFIAYILHYAKNVKSGYKYFALAIIISATTYGAIRFAETEVGQIVSKRTEELSMVSSVTGDDSGFVRIYRGYYVYDNLNFFEKTFGLFNFERLRERINSSSVGWAFEANDDYFNVIQNVLIKTGILGMLIFLIFLFRDLWYKNTEYSKCIIFIFLVFSFVTNMYLTPTMVLYTVLPYYFKYKVAKNQVYE